MIADRINAAAAIVMLVTGGAVPVVGQPPVQAMLAALIVVAGAWQAWCVRQLGGDAESPDGKWRPSGRYQDARRAAAACSRSSKWIFVVPSI